MAKIETTPKRGTVDVDVKFTISGVIPVAVSEEVAQTWESLEDITDYVHWDQLIERLEVKAEQPTSPPPPPKT
jgi:hypothetical protein